MLNSYKYLVLVLSTILSYFCCTVNSEVFTAVTDMEPLLNFEGNLLRHLSFYIFRQERKLGHISNRLLEHGWHSSKTHKNKSSPMNSYLTNKRMFIDWPNIEINILDKEIQLEYFEKIDQIRKNRRFPGDEDLNGAAIALTRLQQTYRLNTTDLANGKIKDTQYNINMSSNDCHKIGFETMHNKKHGGSYTVLWLKEALNRLKPHFNSSNEIQILNDLATAHKNQEDYTLAIEAIDRILAIDSNNEMAMISKAWLEESNHSGDESPTVLMHKEHAEIEREMVTHTNPIQHTNPLAYEQYERLLYEAVCRGDIKSSPKDDARLRCRYQSHKSPFLKIAPLKLEEISLQPLIILYHDVMSDKEINLIQKKAKKILARAEVETRDNQPFRYVDYRISKLAWFDDTQHKYVADVTRRVQDMTGFTMESSESLQVVNYGIGGFYATHFDHTPDDDKTYGYGNRIATVMFYMSDVAAGGATAFPFLKKAVYPEKGSAIFWLNLHANGTGNVLTKHAGCPVLVGSKWVSNKWIHLEGQERTRPCGLYPEYEDDF